jgi:hypothetical protein
MENCQIVLFAERRCWAQSCDEDDAAPVRNVNEASWLVDRNLVRHCLGRGPARQGSSATLLWKNYKNPESQTRRLLNQQHLDGIIDAIVSYNVFLRESNVGSLFCFPDSVTLPIQHKSFLFHKSDAFQSSPDQI